MLDLQEKVDLLFTHPPRGQRLTYSDVQRLGNVEPAALSRIRSGQTKEPSYLTVQGLATAFQIPVEYFYAPVNRDEAIAYLTDIENTELLEVLQQRVQDERQQKVADIALRASHLDEEGIKNITQMIDYILKQKST
jgi:transcriptional regulator with XRE-family HTH domain